MHGAEAGNPPRRRQQRGRPGDGLEGCALVVGLAAIALPAPDRQHEIDAGLVGHTREPEIVGPGTRPSLRNLGDRAPRRAVGAEQAELEPVAAVHGHSVAQGSVCIPDVHSSVSHSCCGKSRRLTRLSGSMDNRSAADPAEMSYGASINAGAANRAGHHIQGKRS